MSSAAKSIERFTTGQEQAPTSTPPKTFALDAAIASASQHELSSLLQQLCSRNKLAATFASKHLKSSSEEQRKPPSQPRLRSILKKSASTALLRNSGFEQSSPSRGSRSSESSSSSRSSHEPRRLRFTDSPPNRSCPPKRKAPTQCRNCGSASINEAKPCVHHPGEREVDDEHKVWENFDPLVFGDAWTLMEYARFANGFRWSCCKKNVGEEGCTIGKHEVVDVDGWKRAKR